MDSKPRIAICGPGRCGKDAISNWLARCTILNYCQSTSQAAAELVFRALRDKYQYKCSDEAFEDRHNHRQEWASAIWAFNQPDGIRLYTEMLVDNDILNGIRKKGELKACQDRGLINLSIWIDRPGAFEPHSLELAPHDCDIIIPNHGTLQELYARLANLTTVLNIWPNVEVATTWVDQ
jgi:hypothetical protein